MNGRHHNAPHGGGRGGQARGGGKQQGQGRKYPYDFVRRAAFNGQCPPLHDRLDQDRFDLALEVEWELITPTALNPCNDPDVPETMPQTEKKEFNGYNKRWLTIDGHPAISPFTVKSAIANGFANLMGGCYRVITKEEGHAPLEEGNYPYNGGWKRYRVSMANSRPGILVGLEILPDGRRRVEIQPVKEFYYQQEGSFEKDREYAVKWQHPVNRQGREDRNKRIINTVLGTSGSSTQGEMVRYHGPFRFGMNLTLGPGQLGKRHRHRFYQQSGKSFTGELRAELFQDVNRLKKIVYMGNFKHGPFGHDPRQEGGPWHEDLTALQPGDWVYYQCLGQELVSIGKCFQHKALFLHEDAVPPRQRLCRDMDNLCPRCALFGMTGEEKGGDARQREAVGLRGRFKAGTLVCEQRLRHSPKSEWMTVPVKARLDKWELEADGAGSGRKEPGAYQALLPILGPPKPSKRDLNGYFNQGTGQIKGVKTFKHFRINEINEDALRTLDDRLKEPDCKHSMRNYAQICVPGLKFSGTLGVENCSAREAAALLVLLEHSLAHHGFKLGLGKSLGMGSVVSRIRKVWVRRAESYAWKSVESASQNLVADLEKMLPEAGLGEQFQQLKAKHSALHKLDSAKLPQAREFEYPKPGLHYWKKVGI